MTLKVKFGGSWVEPSTVKAKDAGTWKQVQKVWAKLSGTWQEIWSYITVALSNASDTDYLLASSGTVTAGFRFLTNSGVQRVSDDVIVYYAVDPTSEASNYAVRFTVLSGSPAGSFGTVLDLSAGPHTFSIARSTFGTTTASVRAEILDGTTLSVLDTADFSLTATLENPI